MKSSDRRKRRGKLRPVRSGPLLGPRRQRPCAPGCGGHRFNTAGSWMNEYVSCGSSAPKWDPKKPAQNGTHTPIIFELLWVL